MWDRLLRNARVVDPVNGRDGVMDVAVKDGRIAAVGPNLQGEASEVEDLTGLVVMPGLIDPHLHLGSMFGSAYGTRMAAAAGVTPASTWRVPSTKSSRRPRPAAQASTSRCSKASRP